MVQRAINSLCLRQAASSVRSVATKLVNCPQSVARAICSLCRHPTLPVPFSTFFFPPPSLRLRVPRASACAVMLSSWFVHDMFIAWSRTSFYHILYFFFCSGKWGRAKKSWLCFLHQNSFFYFLSVCIFVCHMIFHVIPTDSLDPKASGISMPFV